MHFLSRAALAAQCFCLLLHVENSLAAKYFEQSTQNLSECDYHLLVNDYQNEGVDIYKPHEPVYTAEDIAELESAFKELLVSEEGKTGVWKSYAQYGWASFHIDKINNSTFRSAPFETILRLSKKCLNHINSLNLTKRFGLSMEDTVAHLFRYQFDHETPEGRAHSDAQPTLIHFIKGTTTVLIDEPTQPQVGDTLLIHGNAYHKVPETNGETRIYCFARWNYGQGRPSTRRNRKIINN